LKRTPILSALASLALVGCTTLRPDPNDDITLPVRNVLTRMEDAWNRGDLDGYMKGYWNSDDLVFFSGGDRTLGWRPVFERYQKRYKSEGKEMGHLTFSKLEIHVLDPNAVFVRGNWQLDFQTIQPRHSEGLTTLVMKRLPEGWRIVHDHSSVSEGH
jgi:ketosteroid isomerase-like protein